MTGFEPGFISPLENITVAAGRSAQFTCVVKHLGSHKVKKSCLFMLNHVKIMLNIVGGMVEIRLKSHLGNSYPYGDK